MFYSINDILKKFPPSTQNNARAYIRRLIERFEKRPSGFLAQQIEELTGETVDFKDEDLIFDERQKTSYPEVSGSEDNKEPY